MNVKTIEEYILSHENVKKKAIKNLNYVRYTVYDSMFAAFSDTKKGIILTIFGRFEQYERDYAGIVVPSVDNDARLYSSVYLEKESSLPEHVIKSMIDYSFTHKLKSVPVPYTPVHKFENIPYCGVVPNTNEVYEGKEIPIDIEKIKELVSLPVEDVSQNWTIRREEPQEYDLISDGKWNNVPYSAPNNLHVRKAVEAEIRKIARLAKKNKKAESPDDDVDKN